MADNDITKLPATRKLAIAADSNFYFTGLPCKYGHVDKRYTQSSTCVTCAIDRASAWQKENPEQHGVYVRNWSAKNPEIMEASQVKYRDAHRTELNAAANERRLADPELFRRRNREWYARNSEEEIRRVLANAKAQPARVNATVNKRRATKLAADGFYLANDVMLILERQRGLCIGCDKDITKQHAVDHYIPLSRGGGNWPENLQLLCRSCNARKTTLTMEEWLLRRGGPDNPDNARILWAMEVHRQLNSVPLPVRVRPTAGIAGMKWSTNDIECERRKTDVPLPEGWRWGRLPMPNRKRPDPGLKRKQKLPPLPLLDDMEDAA